LFHTKTGGYFEIEKMLLMWKEFCQWFYLGHHCRSITRW
jgi:hypothetical protein